MSKPHSRRQSGRLAIRAVAVDMDGTLIQWTDGGGRIEPAAAEAFVAARAQGVLLGTATGRSISDQQRLVTEGGLTWGHPFPQFVVAREKFVYWVEGGALREEAAWNRLRAEEMRALAAACIAQHEAWLTELTRAGLAHKWSHVLEDYALEIGFDTEPEAAQACVLLKRAVAEVPLAAVHRNHTTANVVLRTGTKGPTLRGLAERMGCSPGQILAIGDSHNDLDMVDGRHGLTGGVVGNAVEELKQAVRAAGGFVAAADYSAGIAEIMAAALRPGPRR